MIKTTFRIIKDKPSGANDLSAERTYLNKEWVDKEKLVDWIHKNKHFDKDSFIVTNDLLEWLGVDEWWTNQDYI